jgi:hypothetical protein
VLIERLERAKAEGELPSSVDIEGLTSLLYAVVQGICLQAGSGATRDQLEKLVDSGMMLWPSN